MRLPSEAALLALEALAQEDAVPCVHELHRPGGPDPEDSGVREADLCEHGADEPVRAGLFAGRERRVPLEQPRAHGQVHSHPGRDAGHKGNQLQPPSPGKPQHTGQRRDAHDHGVHRRRTAARVRL